MIANKPQREVQRPPRAENPAKTELFLWSEKILNSDDIRLGFK